MRYAETEAEGLDGFPEANTPWAHRLYCSCCRFPLTRRPVLAPRAAAWKSIHQCRRAAGRETSLHRRQLRQARGSRPVCRSHAPDTSRQALGPVTTCPPSDARRLRALRGAHGGGLLDTTLLEFLAV